MLARNPGRATPSSRIEAPGIQCRRTQKRESELIEISPSAMGILALAMSLCMAAGLSLSQALPWSERAKLVAMPLTTGLALGPFLFGLTGILILGLLPGALHQTHLFGAIGIIVAVLIACRLANRERTRIKGYHKPLPLGVCERILVVALLFVAGALLFISVFVPLTQNDSLEYATVGRILYETRLLGAYPVLDPEANSAGFFGPWTHPPLYVAAIYLVEVIQGHADAPGALRLIAPWFATTAAGVVYSTGALLHRMAGLAGALVFLSTPLLYLGAGSGLLDAQYVSAFALVIAFVSSIKAAPLIRGALIGVVIGLGLWTHSVAILFLPLGLAALFLCHGMGHLRVFAKEAAMTFLFALLFGGWHYWHNIELFGAPISDNPAVFALASLRWDDYFIINRGLDTPVAMLQYGILKGWFAIESFGASYWAMGVGLLGILTRGRRPAWRAIWRGTCSMAPQISLPYFVYGLILAYIAGTVLSVILGLDIMVKNERYLLSIQALIAIGAGFAFVEATSFVARWTGFGLARVRQAAAAALALVLSAQSLVCSTYALGKSGLGFANFGASFSETLKGVPEYQLMEFLRTKSDERSVVLSLKPADMYYAGRRMFSYLDERLIPFYLIEQTETAAARLRELGITHVHVPDYGIPPVYNSALYRILRSPSESDLLISTTGGQIYALTPDHKRERAVADIGPSTRAWSREQHFFLGGRKRLVALATDSAADLKNSTSRTELPFGLFQRNVITFLRLGTADTQRDPTLLMSHPGAEIAIDVELQGAGLVGLLVNEFKSQDFTDRNAWLRTTRLTSFELSAKQPRKAFARRMEVSNRTQWLSVVIEHQGQSEVTVRSVRIYSLD